MKPKKQFEEPRRTRLFPLLAGQVLVLGVLAGSLYLVQPREMAGVEQLESELNPALVAVLPFRVDGVDPTLGYLREGMVDLLTLKFTGPRQAVDARSALAAWRSDTGDDADRPLAVAKRVATQLGAGTMLLGGIVATGEAITLSASLYDVATGQQLAGSSASGKPHELPALVDRLVGGVLGADAATSGQLDSLTSMSPSAVRGYLEGNAYYRRAQYRQAVESYAAALEQDSTFALAALNVVEVASMELDVPGEWATRGRQLLRAYRDRLSPRDRAYADARWLAEPATSVAAELGRLEYVAQQFPDRPETWYHFADALYHNGALVGDSEHVKRARAGFERALAFDSTNAVVQHLLSAADLEGDTTFLFRLGERYMAAEPDGGLAYEHQLRQAHWRRDTASLRLLYAGLDTLDAAALTWTIIDHQHTPRSLYRLDFARRATELLADEAESEERNDARLYRYQLEMNAGRPHVALTVLDSVPPGDRLAWDRRRVYDAVYWDGDSAAAAVAASRIERQLRRVRSGPLTDHDASGLCAVAALRLARGKTDGVATAIERLRVPHPASTSPQARELCALNLAAVLSHTEGAPDAAVRLIELDSVLRTGPLVAGFREQGNITAARLFEARGDVQRALAASRRRLLNAGGQSYVSTFFELECRLAAMARDGDAATPACTRYLALRSDPEPPLAVKAAAARAQLQQAGTEQP